MTSNTNQGRDYIVPPQVDKDGNSIITGKPPVTNLDIYQAQQKTAEVPDWSWDPNVGPKDAVPPSSRPVRENAVIPNVPNLQIPNWGYIPNPEEALHIPPAPSTRQPTPIVAKVRGQQDPNWNWRPNEGEQTVEIHKPKGQEPKGRFHVTKPMETDWNWDPQKDPM